MGELALVANAAVALGLEMLVGLERERHKVHGEARAFAGLPTSGLLKVFV
ncbi:hypothetical protein C8K61_106260 [Pseudomonas sp. GV071]|nr:hypothetical protein C8K61_106260 [Pseudomonas sp. GV071]